MTDILEAILIVLIIILAFSIVYFGWYIHQEPIIYPIAQKIAIFGLQATLATIPHNK